MIETAMGSWSVLLFLGALHGVNPGMGWLFAVGLGLQEQNGRAVWRSLGPLALGHAMAVAAAVLVAVLLGAVVAPRDLRWVVAGVLFGMGLFHLRRHRHAGRIGMRVGARDLVLWSFLMATAHGAGLMAVPFVPQAAPMRAEAHAAGHAHHGNTEPAGQAAPLQTEPAPHRHFHGGHHGATGRGWGGVVATLVHTLGYLAATGAIAAVVFYRLGLRMLNRAWFNIDRLWAGALVATALITLVI